MTMAPAMIPRKFPIISGNTVERLFAVEEDAKVHTFCHWQRTPREHATLILVHGLEGSAEAIYMLGTAEKAFASGMNVIRINMRNCCGHLHLTKTLYNSGMTCDVLAIVNELREVDGLQEIYLSGCSMGGNIVLKAAAELDSKGQTPLAGVCAVSPALDLAACVDELERGFNRMYEARFLQSLKTKIRQKAALYPQLFTTDHLPTIKSIRQFDDIYTAPNAGYIDSADYYAKASALPIVDRIEVPTLIIQAQDDPFVPFHSFLSPKLKTPYIKLLAPEYGGHAGFVQSAPELNQLLDRFWAENRIVTFCLEVTQTRQQAHTKPT